MHKSQLVLDLHQILARVMQAKQQKISKARRLYRQALQLEPTGVRCLNGLGSLEARAGNHAAALRCAWTR